MLEQIFENIKHLKLWVLGMTKCTGNVWSQNLDSVQKKPRYQVAIGMIYELNRNILCNYNWIFWLFYKHHTSNFSEKMSQSLNIVFFP